MVSEGEKSTVIGENTIPSEAECYRLMDLYGMYPHIIEHSKQVQNVSLAIAHNLQNPNCIRIDLLKAAALLHDIAKTRSIQTGEKRHDLIGGEMLRELGYPEIAFIVESHVVFANYNHEGALEEREIVFYADKRVKHDKIVSVNERVDDLVKRYGKTEEIIRLIIENKQFVLQLEKKIERFLKVSMETALSQR